MKLSKTLVDKLAGKEAEPLIPVTGEMSKIDLVRALNNYSSNYPVETHKSWCLEWAAKHRPDYHDTLDKIKPNHFLSHGGICRLHLRGAHLDESHINRITTFFDKLIERNQVNTPSATRPTVSRPAPFTKRKIVHNETLANLDLVLDQIVTRQPYQDPEITVTSDLKEVGEYCRNLLNEVSSIEENEFDPDVASNIQALMKRMIKHLDVTVKAKAKANTKKPTPRKKKFVPKSKIVQKVKYQTVDDELNIRSIHPVDILEKKVLWVYNTRYRKLYYFEALAGGFDIRGTKLLNVNLERCKVKRVRKPSEALENYKRKKMLNVFDELSTKPAAVTSSSLNENCIILKGE